MLRVSAKLHCARLRGRCPARSDAATCLVRVIKRLMSALRVLLVDDSPAFLKTAKQFLTDFCGAVVIGCASSGEEAIEMVEELSPQLVLMDLVMEGIGGLEAAQRIKRRDNAPPVVLVSLNACAEYRNIADSLGIDGFVSKTEFTVQIPRLLENLSDAGSGN
jgi:CheY-like chemotaxis protein